MVKREFQSLIYTKKENSIMKYVKPFDNFINESEVYRIQTDEVTPGVSKGSATEEPAGQATEAQEENEESETTEEK